MFCHHGRNFATALGESGIPAERSQKLTCYHSVLARLALFHVPISRELALYKILITSAARSPAALRHYVRSYAADLEHDSLSDHMSIVESIKDWAENDTFSGWDGFRT